MRKLTYLLVLALLMIAVFLGLPDKQAHAASVGDWNPVAAMGTARSRHTATLLTNGTVLVTGGYTGVLNNPVSTSTAEIYYPLSDSWVPAPSMAFARSRHTATALSDGRILVVGGRGGNGQAIPSAEIYDPASETWSSTGSLQTARMDHTATLLADGCVLVAGGQSLGDGLGNWIEKTAEKYDPATGLWTEVPSMANARYGHSATLLADGKVLVVGGAGPSGDSVYTVRTEVFDPVTNRWRNADSLGVARAFHSAVALSDGSVIAAGGFTLPANSLVLTDSAEIFDPSSVRWRPTGSLNVARSAGGAGGVLLPDGSVLVAGGRTSTAEVYDVATRLWSLTGSMATIRSRHVLTLLSDGRVLVTGGENRDGIVASAEVYQP